MKQTKKSSHGFGKLFRYQSRFEVSYDPETQYPVIRGSICTGEKVAGFKNKKDGSFTEVMLIRTPEDKRRFMDTYGIEKIDTEY